MALIALRKFYERLSKWRL